MYHEVGIRDIITIKVPAGTNSAWCNHQARHISKLRNRAPEAQKEEEKEEFLLYQGSLYPDSIPVRQH